MALVPVLSRDFVVELGPGNRPRLAELCRQCTEFFELIEGQPGGTKTADAILGPTPEHVTYGTKRVFDIEQCGDLIGAVETLEGFPEPRVWHVGLLLIAPHLRNVGLGSVIWRDIRKWISQQGGLIVSLIVQKQNPAARRFWERQGFDIEKEAAVTVGRRSSSVWVMSLCLEKAAQHGGVEPGGR